MSAALPTREDHGRVVIDASRLDSATIVVSIDGVETLRVPISLDDLDGEPLSYVEGGGLASSMVQEMVSGRLETTIKPEVST